LHPSISSKKIDSYYEAGLKAGAEGGKILGAGGGGFLLLYCEPSRQSAVCSAMREFGLRHVRFHMSESGSTVVLNTCDEGDARCRSNVA
jgi:D-glycero-alpha-D-manno-heptose-7-phosphate kinase